MKFQNNLIRHTAGGVNILGTDNNAPTQGNAMYIAASGPQTIRIQVREDGLSLDQIVLSADTYAVTAPGATKNDMTVLAR